MPGPSVFYFEDVALHGVLDTPGMTITEAHVALYTGISQETPPRDAPSAMRMPISRVRRVTV